jgi:hypothetical protein
LLADCNPARQIETPFSITVTREQKVPSAGPRGVSPAWDLAHDAKLRPPESKIENRALGRQRRDDHIIPVELRMN